MDPFEEFSDLELIVKALLESTKKLKIEPCPESPWNNIVPF